MTKLTKREQLLEAVVDTAADYRRYKAAADLWNAEVFDDAVFAAWGAWVKAKRELASYLKEQDDD